MDAQTLANVMGNRVSMARYEQLTHAWNEALIQAGCNTPDRVAMFISQIGTESGGLQWMEELASGSEYEGRSDLGNIYPGDGVRYKGRGPIQITGRYNYGKVSQWAFDNGYVPTPTYFVDNPSELSNDQYGFLGAVWYWTVARNMNSYADANDIYGATRAVNGGLNGIDSRINYWNSAKALGNALLPDKDIIMVRFVNSDGIEVGEDTFMKYADQRLIEIRAQITGSGKVGEYPGWGQLGDRTLVDALAAIGAKLGIDGFKDLKADKK